MVALAGLLLSQTFNLAFARYSAWKALNRTITPLKDITNVVFLKAALF